MKSQVNVGWKTWFAVYRSDQRNKNFFLIANRNFNLQGHNTGQTGTYSLTTDRNLNRNRYIVPVWGSHFLQPHPLFWDAILLWNPDWWPQIGLPPTSDSQVLGLQKKSHHQWTRWRLFPESLWFPLLIFSTWEDCSGKEVTLLTGHREWRRPGAQVPLGASWWKPRSFASRGQWQFCRIPLLLGFLPCTPLPWHISWEFPSSHLSVDAPSEALPHLRPFYEDRRKKKESREPWDTHAHTCGLGEPLLCQPGRRFSHPSFCSMWTLHPQLPALFLRSPFVIMRSLIHCLKFILVHDIREKIYLIFFHKQLIITAPFIYLCGFKLKIN